MLVSLHGGERKSFTTRACTFVSSSNLENYSASILTNRCRHSIDVILGLATFVIQYSYRRAIDSSLWYARYYLSCTRYRDASPESFGLRCDSLERIAIPATITFEIEFRIKSPYDGKKHGSERPRSKRWPRFSAVGDSSFYP